MRGRRRSSASTREPISRTLALAGVRVYALHRVHLTPTTSFVTYITTQRVAPHHPATPRHTVQTPYRHRYSGRLSGRVESHRALTELDGVFRSSCDLSAVSADNAISVR